MVHAKLVYYYFLFAYESPPRFCDHNLIFDMTMNNTCVDLLLLNKEHQIE